MVILGHFPFPVLNVNLCRLNFIQKRLSDILLELPSFLVFQGQSIFHLRFLLLHFHFIQSVPCRPLVILSVQLLLPRDQEVFLVPFFLAQPLLLLVCILHSELSVFAQACNFLVLALFQPEQLIFLQLQLAFLLFQLLFFDFESHLFVLVEVSFVPLHLLLLAAEFVLAGPQLLAHDF